ncbi:MAG: DUF502 domain-containing protein [Candidatus Omnitrophota bacterium]
MVKLRRYFLSGLIIFLPLSLTLYLFMLMLDFADGLLGNYIEPYFLERFGFYFRGISIVISVSIIFLMGFFVTNFLGKKIHAAFEGLLLRLPFFRQVYPAIKEIALFLFTKEKLRFKQVVFVEYPRKGIYSLGFVTNDTSEKLCEKIHKRLCNVFVPTAPGPLTGNIILVPKDELIIVEVSVEDAVRFLVSGGVVNPG